MRARRQFWLVLAVLLAAAGGVEASAVDADGDGVTDGNDACPNGESGWASGPDTDRDGDGCLDVVVLAGWPVEDGWAERSTGFELAEGQRVELYVVCDHGCHYNADLELHTPDGRTVWWEAEYGGLTMFSVGDLSGVHGRLESSHQGDTDRVGRTYGDPTAAGGWTLPGVYHLEAATWNGSGGWSVHAYLVGSGEDPDDDGDGVLDGDDRCHLGATGWTSTADSDVDGDGCRDRGGGLDDEVGEDFDDDDDGLMDYFDQCVAPYTNHGGSGIEPLQLDFADGDAGAATLLGTAAIVDTDDGPMVRMDADGALDLPADLATGFDPARPIEWAFRFRVDRPAGEFNEFQRPLLGNRQDAWSLGVALMFRGDQEEGSLWVGAWDQSEVGAFDGVVGENLEYGTTYEVRMRIHLDRVPYRIETVLLGDRQTKTLVDFVNHECFRDHVLGTALRSGAPGGWDYRPDEGRGEGGEAGIVFLGDLRVASPALQGDADVVRAALVDVTEHLRADTGSDEEVSALVSAAVAEFDGQWPDLREEVLAYLDAWFEARGTVFTGHNGDNWVPTVDEPLRYLAFYLGQWVHDHGFSPEHIEGVAGVAFEDHRVFPGPVAGDAPRQDGVVVPVRGTYVTDPGYLINDQEWLRQPTGLYVPAGELVEVTAPAEAVGHGLELWVGAHQTDLGADFTDFARFPRIGKRFVVDTATLTVGSPFGGGLYVAVPDGTDLGMLEFVVDGAVAAPLYSTRTGFPTTTYDDWAARVGAAHVPWADMVSDSFMTSLPISMVDDTTAYVCRLVSGQALAAFRTCTFEVPVGRVAEVDALVHVDYDEFAARVTTPDGREVHVDSLDIGDMGDGIRWLATFEEPGAYTIDLGHDRTDVNVTFTDAMAYDPAAMLEAWDAAMAAYMVQGGWPVERTHPMWLLPDVQNGASGTAAPAGNPMVIGSPVSFGEEERWWADPRQVLDHNFVQSGIFVMFHEWGHAHHNPTLDGEGESGVNTPITAIYHLGFGLDLDEAHRWSSFQLMDRTEAVVDWMVTENFRSGGRIGPLRHLYTEEGYPLDQVSYQARGHAKYVDVAHLFGWEFLGAMRRPWYEAAAAGDGPVSAWPSDAEFLVTASQGVGYNMTPLFDFWGIIPDERVHEDLAELPVPVEIRDLLVGYRELVPRDNAEFADWQASVADRIGDWQGPQVESYLDTYDEASWAAAVARIDTLLCRYYGERCDQVGEERLALGPVAGGADLPQQEPEPGPEPDPEPGPEPEPGPDPGLEPDPEPGPDPGLEPDPEPGPDPGPDPEPGPSLGGTSSGDTGLVVLLVAVAAVAAAGGFLVARRRR